LFAVAFRAKLFFVIAQTYGQELQRFTKGREVSTKDFNLVILIFLRNSKIGKINEIKGEA